jgi:hypothetical protein
MKKTNNVKANKVQAKANNKANTTAAQAKTNNAKQLTVKPYDGISVTLENKTLSQIKSWAYHLTKDLDNLFIDLNYAVEDGTNIDFIPYTEDELNEMIAQAGFAINFFDPNDTEIYRWYFNAYGCCRYIMDRCATLTHVLHGNYDGLGWVKSKYKFSTLPIDIEYEYHRLYTIQSNIGSRLITKVSYTRDELYSIIGKAARTLNDLDKYDCSDVCNVELTKYFCTEAINIVNDLLDTIENNDTITCKDNKTNTAIGYKEYDDF